MIYDLIEDIGSLIDCNAKIIYDLSSRNLVIQISSNTKKNRK